MKTCVDVERARVMRESGMTLQAIGDEFGVTRERIRQLVVLPSRTKTCDNCGQPFETKFPRQAHCSMPCYRALYYEHGRRECVDCGTPIGPRSERCIDCYITKHERARFARWDRIEELWAEGTSLKAIALAVGKTPGSLGVDMARMKHAGRELPSRRKGWKGHSRPCGPTPRPPETKDQSRFVFSQAVRNGQIERPNICERCGREGRVDGHHHDYSKPLDVEWLCRSCHMAHHIAERQAA